MPTKRPYLRVANVYENELRLDEIQEIGVTEKELDRVSLEEMDLLVVEGNGSLDQIGRVAIWNDEIQGCVHQNHLIKIRCHQDRVNPQYLLYYLMSPPGKNEIVDRATSGAGLYTLSISKISSIAVPIFGLSEQTEIVRRVEELFAFADTIEQKAAAALERVNNLTQSILAKAFRGELTADWRAANPELITGDNSAEALLVKIQGERELLKMKPKRSNSKKKVGNQVSKKIIKVVDALVEAGKPLSGQQLLSAAGYPNDSDTEALERFFLDIRDYLARKLITQVEQNDGEDWFSLPDIKVEK